MIRYERDSAGVDWQAAVDVIRRAPLGARDPGKLARAFQNSYAKVIVFDDQKLIGLARALCDGEYQAAIYDVVLLPEYQGKRVGQEMLRRLCEQLPVPNIILYATPGREGFYKKCGFKRMLTGMAVLQPSMAPGFLEDEAPSR